MFIEGGILEAVVCPRHFLFGCLTMFSFVYPLCIYRLCCLCGAKFEFRNFIFCMSFSLMIWCFKRKFSLMHPIQKLFANIDRRRTNIINISIIIIQPHKVILEGYYMFCLIVCVRIKPHICSTYLSRLGKQQNADLNRPIEGAARFYCEHYNAIHLFHKTQLYNYTTVKLKSN